MNRKGVRGFVVEQGERSSQRTTAPLVSTKQVPATVAPKAIAKGISAGSPLISIIVLGHDEHYWKGCKSNIEQTTQRGTYELVFVDNRANAHNIFTGYNQGASQSKASLLLFMHEDVRMMDKGWLTKVCRSFKLSPRAGIVGVIGSTMLCKDLTWWDSPSSEKYGRVVHGGGKGEVLIGSREVPNDKFEVVVVDGLWMVSTRKCFEAVGGFDERTYNGFHFYDIDFCISARAKGFGVYLVNTMVRHLYTNSWKKDKTFFDARQRFWKKVASSKTMTKACQRV